MRDVSIKIGKKSYTLQTSLDQESLDRVRAIIAGAAEEIPGAPDQELLLVLSCLQLAYFVDHTLERLEAILRDQEPGTVA
jgi:hypothetical protein